MNAAVSIVRNDGEGERLWFYGGGVHTWKASSAETGGSLMLFEDHMSHGTATPLHVHAHEDEALYVLEGEILAHIDGTSHRVGARVRVRATRRSPRLSGHLDRSAHPLPADARQRGGVLPRRERPAANDTDLFGPVDFARVRESAERTGGMQVLGPPPFDASPDVATVLVPAGTVHAFRNTTDRTARQLVIGPPEVAELISDLGEHPRQEWEAP
jgi:quercetin dioxygenase-like cupin family protein